MTRMPTANLNHQYRSLFGGGRLADLGEGQLLDRFLKERDEGAFEELVARHGPMVLGVCRRWLDDPNDVDDAFQATFLILIRKAGSLRDQKTVSRWLYGVSQRVARRARSQALRLRERLVPVPREAPTSPSAQGEAANREILSIVDEEVRRLPRKQQAVAVLCLVQGWTHEEAARALEWPLGTVKSRVASARETLRSRLSRRGIDAADGWLVALPMTWRIGRSTALTQLSRRILLAIDGVINPANRGSAASTVALELSRGVMRSLLVKNMLIRSATAMLALTAAGAGAMAYQREGGVSSQPGTTARPASRVTTRPPVKQSPLQKAFEKASIAARSIADPAERAEKLLRLGEARTRQGDLEDARAILREALNASEAIKPNSNYVQPHVIIRIAKAQADANDREAAHRTFQQAIQLVAREDWEHQVQNWVNLIPYQVAIEGRARIGETLAAYRRFIENDNRQGNLDLDTLAIIDAARSESWEGALKIINARKFEVDDPGKAQRRSNILMGVAAYFRPDEREQVKPLLIEARRAIDAIPYRFAKPGAFNGLAVQQARLGFFAEAVASAESVDPRDGDVRNPAPNQTGMGAFIRAQAFLDVATEQMSAGDKEGVKVSVRKAVEAIDTMDHPGTRNYPLYRSANLLTHIGEFDGARRLIDRVESQNYETRALRELANYQSKAGDQAGARTSWIRALNTAARDPHQPPGTTAEIQAEMGDLAGALRTVQRIGNEDGKSKALSGVAVAVATMGNLDAAESVVERIKSPRIRDDAWIRVAGAAPGRKNGEP
jgi:RNA polymerase sigma factor (sigma-70 family)